MTTPLSRYRLEAKADYPDPATEPDPATQGPDDLTAEEDPEDEDFFAKQKRKGEGKSYDIEFRPFTGQR